MTTHNELTKQVQSVDFSELPIEKLRAIHTIVSERTTKFCPQCLSTKLAKFSSTNKKVCNECGNTIIWNLDKGQRRL